MAVAINLEEGVTVNSKECPMKIKLIAPHEQRDDGTLSSETFKLPRLSLPLLAALTPPGHEVKIIDESFCRDNPNDDVDLVGITVLTELALRAYQIADQYRRRGVKVVMGGIHPTVLPEEALKHADSVVIGEGEEAWPRLVADESRGKLQRIYFSSSPVEMRGMPLPLRNLYPRSENAGYTPLAYTVETSRGCPYDCEFCSVSLALGRKLRARPVSEVIAEIESFEHPYLFFVDDTLGLNREHARKLFSEMIPLNRLWVGQGGVGLAEDPGLLKLMTRSGCRGLLVGFESIQPKQQEGFKKITNLKIDFMEAMKRFHSEGIPILGSFIFGFDNEDRDVFQRTLEFTLRARVDGLEFRLLTPFPGTRLYSRLIEEKRLFVPDWWLRGYTSKNILFRPKGMTIDELFEGFAYLNHHAYSYSSMVRRFWGMSPRKRTIVGSSLYAAMNISHRKRYFRNLKDPQPFAKE